MPEQRETSTGRPRLGWAELVLVVAVVETVLLAAAGLLFDDRETLVLAALLAGATVLLRFRRGLLGTVACAALLADVAAWTVPGAVSNLAAREEPFDVAAPATLAVFALGGAIAAGARLATWRRPSAGRRAAPLVGAGTLAVTVVAVVAAVLAGIGQERGPRPGDVALKTGDMRFSDESLTVEAGSTSVHLDNRDLFWHTFTVPDLDVDLWVPGRGAKRVTFDAPRGRYRFVCAVPGHEASGMEGVLVVR